MARYDDYKDSSKIIKMIDSNKKDYLIIHYSCESFYNKTDGFSPRITSIAVKKFSDGQTELFAIHKLAEIMKIPFNEMDDHYDELETEMLIRYFHYVSLNKEKVWLHWNMRDSNYGFKAIEHRAEVLGVQPVVIHDDKKIDISRLFIQRYTKRYTGNPRIETLLKQNDITPKDLLYGKEEAEAFEKKEFIKLGMSSASKVDVFSNFLNLAIDNKLITKTNKLEIYGCTLTGIHGIIKDNLFYSFLANIFYLILGGFIGGLITKIFFT